MSRTAAEPASLPEPLRSWLADASLRPLWHAVRTRLERNGLAVTGVVAVTLDERGEDRLAGLLGGQSNRRGALQRVHLAKLDAALRSSAAQAGLLTVTATLTGAPLLDRSAQRQETASSWSAVWARLDESLADAALAGAGWVPTFVDGVRRSGLLTRAGPVAAASACATAGRVLAVLTEVPGAFDPTAGPFPPRRLLGQLASVATGDAHGLDDGRLAAALVLRAGAAAHRVSVPDTAAARREVWALLGVTADLVSGTVLAWGLRPPGPSEWAGMQRVRADLGLVTHLTLQELATAGAKHPLAVAGQRVLVCENPQVVQAAAQARATGTLLCTSGNPAAAGWAVIRRLVADGADVGYHGDFDWPGAAIAGRVLAAGARPWRLGAGDYLSAVDALPPDARLGLTGAAVPTGWDPKLAVAMARARVAVHEEALLSSLLEDLV